VLALAGCGGDDSSPQLVDGSTASELPAELDGLDDAVLTRTGVFAASGIDQEKFAACGLLPGGVDTVVVERAGLHGSSLTFSGSASNLYACDKIADPINVEDPDNPGGGIWCGGAAGRLEGDMLNDPRLDICTNIDGELTAFAWVEPQPDARWVVVSDAGTREVYEMAESLPVRVTTTDGTRPESSRASFAVEEYGADGTKLREYTLEAAVAG
jgi:hypothetical protein